MMSYRRRGTLYQGSQREQLGIHLGSSFPDYFNVTEPVNLVSGSHRNQSKKEVQGSGDYQESSDIAPLVILGSGAYKNHNQI